MKLLLTGLNHRTAPVEVREKLAFEEKTLPEALDQLKSRPGLVEGMILSTCNRVEVAVSADEEADAGLAVEGFLAEARKVNRDWVSPHLYRYDGPEAVRHLFRVASSLDSMIVGEPQILGQLKSAYQLAKERGTLSGDLDLVVTKAFNVAKRVRTETEIGESTVSVSSAAVKLAKEIFGSLQDSRVLVVGAGEMAESAIDHLRRAGVDDILVSNRTRERAEALALDCGGRVVDYERFHDTLPDVDILLASSAAPHYILTWEQMRAAISKRRNRPIFLIDIAVPRNIQPSINEMDNVFLYNIDDLGEQVESNLKSRMEKAHLAEGIIAEEVEILMRRLRNRTTGPLIQSWQEHLEQVRLGEIERRRGKLGNLSPQQEEALEAITRGITNKFLHRIIEELRAKAGGSE